MRIRSIKPEFWMSESAGRLSREARLLFIGLWSACDDSGRTRAASRFLASQLFPYDEDAIGLIDKWMGELEREQMVSRYVVDGCTYLEIPKWGNHQKIDRASESKLPPHPLPREPSRGIDEPSRGGDEPSRTLVIGTGNREQGVEQGTGSGGALAEELAEDAPVVLPSADLVAAARPVLGLLCDSALLDLLRDYQADWIRRAVSVCVDRGKTGPPYLRGILQRWKKLGKPDDESEGGGASGLSQPDQKRPRATGAYNVGAAEKFRGMG